MTSLSREQKLFDTDFTVGWLLDSLTKNDEAFNEGYRNRKVSKITARDISGGKGIFSIVLKCELSFEDSKNDTDIYTTVIKIPGTSVLEIVYKGQNFEEMNFGGMNLIEFIIKMHGTECAFYESIAEHIPQMVPRVFATEEWKFGKRHGCLHMEDLSKNGKNLNFYNSLSHGQLKNIVKHIAFFHKTVMCLDEQSWKGKFLDMKLVFVNVGAPRIRGLSAGFLELAKKNTALKTLYENPKIQEIMLKTEYLKYAITQSHLDIGIPDLLVHSDLWCSNIIFVVDEDGNVTDEVSAILDWQLLHEGNMLLDFVRLMLASLDGDARREAELYIFDFYVDQLNKYLAPEGRKAPYTAEQVKKAYQYMYIAHFVHIIMMAAAIFKSREIKPGEERIEEARIDKCALRVQHAFEDALQLLETGTFDEWLQ